MTGGGGGRTFYMVQSCENVETESIIKDSINILIALIDRIKAALQLFLTVIMMAWWLSSHDHPLMGDRLRQDFTV